MTPRPIKLCIAALGGQGGGVLTDWLIKIAEAEGYLVQSTSVPGVAQRTGATIYYLEFFARAAAERAGHEPIMALMPVAGDVDCVVASELVEAGRAIQRGLVDRQTTLIASSHRSYSIAEKSALGQGAADGAALIELARGCAKRLILFDMDAVAEQHHSVISSVLLGAICGSRVLPFARAAFESAIGKSGISVTTNLAAFADACARAEQGEAVPAAAGAPAGLAERSAALPFGGISASARLLLERVQRLPEAVQPLALEGVRRMLDYQDPAYAALYLTRLERIRALEETVRSPEDPSAQDATGGDWALTTAVARGLALWMSFEDTIRVADLKTRAARFARVRAEIRAAPGQLFGITDFMKPRVAEIAGTMPAALGARVLASARLSRWLARGAGGKRIRTHTVSGFLLLRTVAGIRRWRRGTLRYREENRRIEEWLGRIERLAATHAALAIELARAQRLIKGYGETHERGWKSFSSLTSQLDALTARADGAAVMARLHEAALADEEGTALARELAALGAAADLGSRQLASASTL
jgi:indolepyruvate ferredoxin oxidoreductase, beta subunit